MQSPSFSGCPWESLVTLAPSLWTRPVISCPRMRGPGPIMAMRMSPRHTCRSEPQMPADVTRTTMASGSGSGTGYSRISKGLPVSKKTAALPVSGMVPPSGKTKRALSIVTALAICQPRERPALPSRGLRSRRRARSWLPMTEALAGKWVWVWNWRRCDGGDPAKGAARLRTAGCRGALIKAQDGPRWFDQGRPWREIAAALRAEGLAIGGWAYLYGRDPAGEARLVSETVSYGDSDLFVLDVEAEFEGQPQAAEELCRRVREQVGPGYPLYYSSFAITRYHRSFPYTPFDEHCRGAAPQVYWNAFRWPVAQAVRWTYDDYTAQGTPPQRLFPVAGLSSGRGVPYPAPTH